MVVVWRPPIYIYYIPILSQYQLSLRPTACQVTVGHSFPSQVSEPSAAIIRTGDNTSSDKMAYIPVTCFICSPKHPTSLHQSPGKKK
ncbi:hypothetical protein GDO78_010639 [Eleutherodactylus coqui]|uniref:Uncharacterized protein n=1 Tax=Eleutherodactylus coqui TaxID=57060 RepID=A0A8J6F745_ELECQ|nr:hypothetical protein GDO78_010639 [Eleutherodactylus coqui]